MRRARLSGSETRAELGSTSLLTAPRSSPACSEGDDGGDGGPSHLLGSPSPPKNPTDAGSSQTENCSTKLKLLFLQVPLQIEKVSHREA